MIIGIPTQRLGRYVPGPRTGQYTSCEIVPDEISGGYTLVTVDTEADIDMRSVTATDATAILDQLDQEGYIRADPYIPSGRKRATLNSALDRDIGLLKKLRGQGGQGTAEKIQKGQAGPSRWDGGIHDSVNSFSPFSDGPPGTSDVSEERMTDEELEEKLDNFEKGLVATPIPEKEARSALRDQPEQEISISSDPQAPDSVDFAEETDPESHLAPLSDFMAGLKAALAAAQNPPQQSMVSKPKKKPATHRP